jgi:uncharacterized protein (DUF427 family)
VRAYVPRDDVEPGRLQPSMTTMSDPHLGEATRWHVVAGGRTFEDAAHSYERPPAEAAKLARLVCFDSAEIDVELDG